jgi:hypothetical protein
MLVTCGTCGGKVAKNADNCPHCGEQSFRRQVTCNQCDGSGTETLYERISPGKYNHSKPRKFDCRKCYGSGTMSEGDESQCNQNVSE